MALAFVAPIGAQRLTDAERAPIDAGVQAVSSRTAAASASATGLMIGIAVLVVATGVIACGIPLKRALRIQPTEALKAEG